MPHMAVFGGGDPCGSKSVGVAIRENLCVLFAAFGPVKTRMLEKKRMT